MIFGWIPIKWSSTTNGLSSISWDAHPPMSPGKYFLSQLQALSKNLIQLAHVLIQYDSHDGFHSFNMIQKMFSSQNRDFEESFPRSSRGFSDFPWIFLCFCRPALVQQAVNDRLDQRDSPRRRGHGRHHTACHLVSPNWCIQKSTLYYQY